MTRYGYCVSRRLHSGEQVLHLGVRSVWYSVVVSNGIASAILLVLYFTGIWRKSTIKIHD